MFRDAARRAPFAAPAGCRDRERHAGRRAVAGAPAQHGNRLGVGRNLSMGSPLEQWVRQGYERLAAGISTVLIKSGDASSFDAISDDFEQMPVAQEKFMFLTSYAGLVGKVSNTNQVKRGVDLIVKFREAIPQAYRNRTDGVINGLLNQIASKKAAEGQQEQADYLKSKLP